MVPATVSVHRLSVDDVHRMVAARARRKRPVDGESVRPILADAPPVPVSELLG